MICEASDCDREAFYRLWIPNRELAVCSDCAEVLASEAPETALERL